MWSWQMSMEHHWSYLAKMLQRHWHAPLVEVNQAIFACKINDVPLTSVKITWIVFSLLIWWCVPTNCLKRPSKNSLSHFYKRCVSVPMLTSFLCRSNDAPLTSSNIPYYLFVLLIRQCVSVTCTFFLYRSHDAESTNRSYIFLICGVSLSSGFLYLVTNTL